MMLDLRGLKDRISHGDDPDLYRGILGLDPRVPVPAEVSTVFLQAAAAIHRLYPNRASSSVSNAYDARVVVIDFCEHSETTRDDILRVLEQSISWLSERRPE